MPLFAVTSCTPVQHHIKGEQFTNERMITEKRHAEVECQARQDANALPSHPFTTDGCSLWLDRTWQACCVEHDKAYWCGGTADERKLADQALRRCLVIRDHPWLGEIMYWGTRLGGHPWLPFPWRWGYGWAWPGRYENP